MFVDRLKYSCITFISYSVHVVLISQHCVGRAGDQTNFLLTPQQIRVWLLQIWRYVFAQRRGLFPALSMVFLDFVSRNSHVFGTGVGTESSQFLYQKRAVFLTERVIDDYRAGGVEDDEDVGDVVEGESQRHVRRIVKPIWISRFQNIQDEKQRVAKNKRQYDDDHHRGGSVLAPFFPIQLLASLSRLADRPDDQRVQDDQNGEGHYEMGHQEHTNVINIHVIRVVPQKRHHVDVRALVDVLNLEFEKSNRVVRDGQHADGHDGHPRTVDRRPTSLERSAHGLVPFYRDYYKSPYTGALHHQREGVHVRGTVRHDRLQRRRTVIGEHSGNDESWH